jgi:four helix bundle protein
VTSYRDLIAWQKAMELVDLIYRATRAFPAEELYGLTNQLRRSAVSVPCNMAEGRGRRSIKEFLRFLSIACGSLHEVETQVLVAERQAYVSQEGARDLLKRTDEVSRLISGLANALGRNQPSPPSLPLTPRPSPLAPGRER